ncbi:MAG: DUF4167 domain-containing protein [Emcibacter sp.]|nr:DUF4167 domain-containing protein [Emcibacter sp.]
MNHNQNARQNRQPRSGQSNRSHKSNQHNNQKRGGKSRQNNNRGQQPNSPTRQMDSRGPAGNQRGTAVQLYEKYKTLAQDRRATDRLESESLFQHADHYYRVYAEFAATEAANKAAHDKEVARKALEEAERRANAKPVEDVRQNDHPEQPLESKDSPKKPDYNNKPKKPIYVAKNTPDPAQDEPEQPALELDLDVPKKKTVKKTIKKTDKKITAKPVKPQEDHSENMAEDIAPPKKKRVHAAKASEKPPEEIVIATDAEA